MGTWTPYTGGLPRWAAEQLDTIRPRPVTDTTRAAAWRVLARRGALDLAEPLGLAGPAPAAPS